MPGAVSARGSFRFTVSLKSEVATDTHRSWHRLPPTTSSPSAYLLPPPPRAGIVTVLERVKLLSELSALGSVMRINSRQIQIRSAVASIVSKMTFISGVPPPPEDARQRVVARAALDGLLVNRSLRREFAAFESETDSLMAERADALFHMLQDRSFPKSASFSQRSW